MSRKKMIKVTESVTRPGRIRSMGVIGDPGCEGLGTYNMKVYAGALEESGKDDKIGRASCRERVYPLV